VRSAAITGLTLWFEQQLPKLLSRKMKSILTAVKIILFCGVAALALPLQAAPAFRLVAKLRAGNGLIQAPTQMISLPSNLLNFQKISPGTRGHQVV